VITLPGAEQLDGKLSATAENSNVSSKMSLCRPLLKSEVGYCLRLANDQGWHIIPTEGTRVWVEKLAWILELKTPESTEYPKLIFVLRQTDEKRNSEPVCQLHPKIKEWLPSNGWNASDLLYLRIWSHTEVPDVICELGPQEGKKENFHSMRMALQPVYQRTQDSGGLPLHAALVERNGFGVMLAASGGIGKSTCCRRLRDPWRPLCDDEVLVVCQSQNGYLAHPFPTWSDYFADRSDGTLNIGQYVPVKAIFFLEQSETDKVVPMGRGQSAVLMYQSAAEVCHRNWMKVNREEVSTFRKKLFENSCRLAKAIPAFRLRVSLQGRFWEKIEEVLP
jgi:SynChlorMet cassette protein ScmC